MIYFLCFVLLNILVSTSPAAGKGKSVNLNLETVLEFDNKNLDTDVKIIDNVQNFLSKVRNVLDKSKNFRRSFGKDNVKFTDFVENVISLLLTYKDEELEAVAAIVDEELRKYHYKGCKFYELVLNSDFRNFVTDLLEDMKNTRGKKMRKVLDRCLKKLRNREFNDRDLEFVNYVNSLYRANAKDKINSVLKSFEESSKTSRRTRTDLAKIIRKSIRSIIFDHYSNLNANARKDLRMKIANYFIEYIPGKDNEGKAKTIITGAVTVSVEIDGTTVKMKPIERKVTTENTVKMKSVVQEGVREKKSTTEVTLSSLLPIRDLEEEKNNMPQRFISLYAEEILTTTTKPKTKKTKKKSRHHKHVDKKSTLGVPNFRDGPKKSKQSKQKKYWEAMVIKRPKTVMLVREDRPLREILTEHNAVIRVMSSHSPTDAALRMKGVKRVQRKRKHSRNAKSKNHKHSVKEKLESVIEEEITHATTPKQDKLRKRHRQRKSFGLSIESFENNVLDGQYLHRKHNFNDTFSGHKRSALRKREKVERTKKVYRKNLDVVDAFNIVDEKQKPSNSKNKSDYNVKRINVIPKLKAQRHKQKVKQDTHHTYSKHGNKTKKDTKRKKSPKFRAQSSDEKIEATTTSYVSDNYVINKIHNLEKKLEVVLDKIDDQPNTQSTANVLTNTKTSPIPPIPPIVIVNRAKIFENIETTLNYPPIPFWKGTARTTRLMFSSSSSSSSEEVVNDDGVPSQPNNVTIISNVIESIIPIVNNLNTTKTSYPAENFTATTSVFKSDEHISGYHESHNVSANVTTLVDAKINKTKAVRSFVGGDDLFSHENSTVTITSAKAVKINKIEEKSTTKSNDKISTKKDGRKVNKGKDKISTKKYSIEHVKSKVTMTNSIEDVIDITTMKYDELRKGSHDNSTEDTTKKNIKPNKISSNKSDEYPISTIKHEKSNNDSTDNFDKDTMSKEKYDKSYKVLMNISDETAILKNKLDDLKSKKKKKFLKDKVAKSTKQYVMPNNTISNEKHNPNEETVINKEENIIEDNSKPNLRSKDKVPTKKSSQSAKVTTCITTTDLEAKLNETLLKDSESLQNTSNINGKKDNIQDEVYTKKVNASFTTPDSNLTSTTGFHVKFTFSNANMNISSVNDVIEAKKNMSRRSFIYRNPFDSLGTEEDLRNKMDVTLYNWA